MPSKHSTPAAPGPENDGDPGEIPEVPAVSVYGNFANQISVVPSTMMSLLVGFGDISGKQYLIPFVELMINEADTGESDEQKAVFHKIISLENAAYLICDLAGDMSKVCRNLGGIGRGEILLEPTRIDAIRVFASKARDRLQTSLDELARLTEGLT